MIGLESITVRAGGATLLEDISLDFRPGRLTVVLGPNGAGKSTLLDVVAGGRRPVAGRVTLAGRAAASWSALELARMRAVLAQSTQLAFEFTVADVVALGRQPFAGTPAMRDDARAIAAAAAQLGIEALWHRVFPGLSGGEQQRVHMARVLAQLWRTPGQDGPRFLLLDEPTSALDLRHRGAVLACAKAMARGGACVVAVLHDLNMAAAFADDAVLLRGGRLLETGPAHQVLTASALGACFEIGVEALTRRDGTIAFVT